MKKQIEKLARETALYSISSILGKFLNWMMVPLYTYVLPRSADYGIITNLYSWTALLLVFLTYGMETGFLRFANQRRDEAGKVYSTTLISVGVSSFLFALLTFVYQRPLAEVIGYANQPEFIGMLGAVVAMDAFDCIPFVYLRYQNRPVRFVAINLLAVIAKIVLNVFFLVICPWLQLKHPSLIDWFYRPDYGVGYVFLANLISTGLVTVILLFDVFVVKFSFDVKLWFRMLKYSLPLVFLGVAGIMNQTFDKILFPFLLPGEFGKAELGIYGATSKIALVIMMLSQAFYYSYEPFIFAERTDKDSMKAYASSMKFYVLIVLTVFLGMVLYMDALKYLIRRDYWIGLEVVPVVMLSYIFQGVYFNLSLWYKLTDKTWYGALFSIIGAVIIIGGNVVLVPMFSYWGSAWATVICYLSIMLISYFMGQKRMPIAYDLKTIGLYSGVTILLFTLSIFIKTPYFAVNFLLKSLLMAAFLVLLMKRDVPLRTIPVVNKFFKHNI